VIEESTDCKRLRNREVELSLNFKRKRDAPKPINKNSKDYKKNINTLNKLENKVVRNITDVDSKMKTIREKRINEIYDVDKDIIKESKAETKSFLVDQKVGDQEAITKRINAILEYKTSKAEFFKKYIINNINSQDIDRYQYVIEIINNIIDEYDRFIVFKNYINARLLAKNLIKNKNNKDYINDKNNSITKDVSIKKVIIDSLNGTNYKKLLSVLKDELLKKKDNMMFTSDAKTEVDNIFNLMRLGKFDDVSKKIDYIFSLNDYAKYTKELLFYLKNKDFEGLQAIIYLLIHEKEYDIKNELFAIASKLNIKLDKRKIYNIKRRLMLAKPTGEAAIFSTNMDKTIIGKMIKQYILKNSKRDIMYVKNIITKITTPTLKPLRTGLHIKSYDYIHLEEIKKFIPDAIKLENTKYNLEKKLLIDISKKLSLNINETNYDETLLKMISPNLEPNIETLVNNLSSDLEGQVLLSNIKNKVYNAIKYIKYLNINKIVRKLKKDLKNTRTSNIRVNDDNERIEEIIKLRDNYKIARKLRAYIKDFVIKSYAVEEIKFLLEVAKMKETQAINNYNKIKETLKERKKDSESDENVKDVLDNAYEIAITAKNKISNLRKQIKKIAADLNKELNLISVKLDTTLKLESNNEIVKLLNEEDKNKESTDSVLNHLKNMHLKQIVINNQKSYDKNILADGYYIDYNLNMKLTDEDIRKYGSIHPKVANLMYKLKDGQTSLMIATIAVLLEKGLKLGSDKLGKCPKGTFDFSNIPEWTKRAIDSIPELGELIDIIGNHLCMKKQCPMKNSYYDKGVCYPRCEHSYKNDKGLMCWKDYKGFNFDKENPQLIKKKVIYSKGNAPNSCDKNEELIGNKCVTKCKSNYVSNGFSCIEKCKDGTVEDGMNCIKKQYDRGIGILPRRKPCPPGYRTDKLTCLKEEECKKWYDKCKTKDKEGNCKAGISITCTGPEIIEREKKCNSNEEMLNGLCYKKCKNGYDSYGTICYSKTESYTRTTYDRNGTKPECPNDHTKINGICYKKCPEGYDMEKPGICIQKCPIDTIDNRTSCTRTGYKRSGGKLEISLYKKPTIEKFLDISNILDLYNIEQYSNIGVHQPFETSYQHDSNYLFESFYNVDTLVKNLNKVENFNINFIAENIKKSFEGMENFQNDSFETNRKYNHEFSDEDIEAGKKYENDGFYGLDKPRMESSYMADKTQNFPIFKKQRSHKYNSYQEASLKDFKIKDSRPIDKTYIVQPKMGGFASYNLSLKPNNKEFLKTSYKPAPPSHPEILPFDINLYNPNEKSNDFSYIKKVLNAKAPEPEKQEYYSPILQQIVREMINSFPLPQNQKAKMNIDIRELITKVKKELYEGDFKNKRPYKDVLKQIYIQGPVVTVVPNLSEG
jgi:hypothetical protein